MKMSMIVIDLMIWITLIVETGHIVEIDLKTTVEMSIRKKIINIRGSLEIIMKTPMRIGMIGININTNTYETYNLCRDRSREKQHQCNEKKTLTFQNLS